MFKAKLRVWSQFTPQCCAVNAEMPKPSLHCGSSMEWKLKLFSEQQINIIVNSTDTKCTDWQVFTKVEKRASAQLGSRGNFYKLLLYCVCVCSEKLDFSCL